MYTPKLTQAGLAIMDKLHDSGYPVITAYQLFREFYLLHISGKKLRLRQKLPDQESFARLRKGLLDHRILSIDADYRRVYRIVKNNDGSAEDICCLVDPFCYLSHLSAMARYGLTDRRPHGLQLTAANSQTMGRLVRAVMESDYGIEGIRELEANGVALPQYSFKHPDRVRNREVSVYRSNQLGEMQNVRGAFARISTIGQTFVEMLQNPQLCGGMNHVLEVWEEHASVYCEDIISSVDQQSSGIIKVRAGYILDEKLGISSDSRVESWVQYAQRGGTRVLDPSSPFASSYSSKWMISINVS